MSKIVLHLPPRQGDQNFSLVAVPAKTAILIPVIKYSQEEQKTQNIDGIIPILIINLHYDGDDTENDGGYEGAVVLKPKPGIYIKKPTAHYATLIRD